MAAHGAWLADLGRSAGGRSAPQVNATFDGVPVDLRELVSGEAEVVECRDVLLQLSDAARPDQDRGDTGDREAPRR